MKENKMKKVLYKIENGKKIDGVCGGIAEYFRVDPTLVRVVWIIFTCCSFGAGLLAYIICSLIMPRKNEVIKRK